MFLIDLILTLCFVLLYLTFKIFKYLAILLIDRIPKDKIRILYVRYFYNDRYFYLYEWGDYIKSAGASLFIVGFVGLIMPVPDINIYVIFYVMFLGIIIGEGGIRMKKKASSFL